MYTTSPEACRKATNGVENFLTITRFYHKVLIVIRKCNTITDMPKFFEDYKRSIIKSITFRALILISDGIIVFAITHRYDLTAGVIVFSNISSTILYFIHERFWNHVHWGKMHQQ
jgi:uncharacterized membrane protein